MTNTEAQHTQGGGSNTAKILEMTNEEYHAHPAISRSMIMDFIEHPQKCWYSYMKPGAQKEETDAMRFGTALHTAILERERFEFEYIDAPVFEGKGSRAAKKEFEFKSAADGKKTLDIDDLLMIKTMRDNFNACPYAQKNLENAKIEQSIFWTDEETGLQLKIRPDFFTPKMPFDIKTTSSIVERDFRAAIFDYGYDIQAAMVCDGLKAVTGIEYPIFVILAFLKRAPYPMASFRLEEDVISMGRARYRGELVKIKKCIDDSIKWHVPQKISLSEWAITKIQEEYDYVY